MEEQNQLAERVEALAAEACVELLEAYGVTLTPSAPVWQQSPDDAILFGIMGFVGEQLRATCLLGMTQELLESMRPQGARLRDWLGELANQLLGRLKMKLTARGLNVALTTPLALSGVRLTPLPRAGVGPMVFVSPHGPVLVWLETEAEPGVALAPELPLDHQPGELLLF
jgi:CheY-specific phosphatase CheX